MLRNDIGIDLGTTKTIINIVGKGIMLDEPSVVATNLNTGEVMCIGAEAYKLVGKTPSNILAKFPLEQGVISDDVLTEKMVQAFVKRATDHMMVKPRVAICIPSGVTPVESRAVVKAALSAGARKVYLVEEPVAAALGAGLNIRQPAGQLVIDIGGGTCDVAVISLSGIVTKQSLRVAGNVLNDAIVKYMVMKHKLLVGARMAEMAKIEIGEVFEPSPQIKFKMKGRGLTGGLPQVVEVSQIELYEALLPLIMQIVKAVKDVLERTPPELVGDIFETGIVLTGGGAMLKGLPTLIKEQTRLDTVLAPDAKNCVAIGTAMVFEYLNVLRDGVIDASLYKH